MSRFQCCPAKKAGIASTLVTTHQPRNLEHDSLSGQTIKSVEFNLIIALDTDAVSSSQHGSQRPTCDEHGRAHRYAVLKFISTRLTCSYNHDQSMLTSSIRHHGRRRQPWRLFLVQQADLHCRAFAYSCYSYGTSLPISEAKATPRICTPNLLKHTGRPVRSLTI